MCVCLLIELGSECGVCVCVCVYCGKRKKKCKNSVCVSVAHSLICECGGQQVFLKI